MAADIAALQVAFRGQDRLFPWIRYSGAEEDVYARSSFVSPAFRRLSQSEEWAEEGIYESLGPGIPSDNMLAVLLDKLALTDDEGSALKALQLILGSGFHGIAAVGDIGRRHRRRIVVKSSDFGSPVPLARLGDGATRFLSIILTLLTTGGGLLLIDEVENGIYHLAQQRMWELIIQTAEQHNVEVLATTHRSDAVIGLAKAANALGYEDVALVRLERRGEELRVVEFDHEQLLIAANSNIEIR